MESINPRVSVLTDNIYELRNNVNPSGDQTLVYSYKEGKTTIIHDGTTPIDVLSTVIHQIRKDHKNNPTREKAIAVTNLEQALLWLENDGRFTKNK